MWRCKVSRSDPGLNSSYRLHIDWRSHKIMQDVLVLYLIENAWLESIRVQVREKHAGGASNHAQSRPCALCQPYNILIIHQNAHTCWVSRLVRDTRTRRELMLDNPPCWESNSASSESNNNYWNALYDLSLTARADPYSASLATFGPRHNRLISDQL